MFGEHYRQTLDINVEPVIHFYVSSEFPLHFELLQYLSRLVVCTLTQDGRNRARN